MTVLVFVFNPAAAMFPPPSEAKLFFVNNTNGAILTSDAGFGVWAITRRGTPKTSAQRTKQRGWEVQPQETDCWILQMAKSVGSSVQMFRSQSVFEIFGRCLETALKCSMLQNVADMFLGPRELSS